MQKIKSPYSEYTRKILKAQNFIQKNLNNKMCLEEIAKAANFSSFHFHRIFQAYTGESPNEYVRRLRMEKSAGLLRYTHKSITDIALDSGYHTPSSFSNAFHKVMKLSPNMYRNKNIICGNNLKLSKNLSGEKMIKPEIVKTEDLSVIFIRAVGSYEKTPSIAWNSLLEFAINHKIDLNKTRRFSIGIDDPNITEEEKLRFDACLLEPENFKNTNSIGQQTLKGGNYAVFLHKGPYANLNSTFNRIFLEWYPKNKEKVADKNCFCEHLNMDIIGSNPTELLTKIYVPLL